MESADLPRIPTHPRMERTRPDLEELMAAINQTKERAARNIKIIIAAIKLTQ